MKKLILIVLIINSSVASFSQSGKCDCSIYPFKPDSCKAVCFSDILQKANLNELNFVLGVPDSISKKIINYRQKNKVVTVNELDLFLKKEELELTGAAIEKLNDKTINYFNLPRKDREKQMAGFKNRD